MSKKKELTKAQQTILDCIVDYIDENGYAPSVRDICERVNLSSPSTVKRHLDNLCKKGYIKVDSMKARAIVVIKEE